MASPVTRSDIEAWRDSVRDHPRDFYFMGVQYADWALKWGEDSEAWKIVEMIIRMERGEINLRAFLFSIRAGIPSQEVPAGREMMRMDRLPRRDRAVEIVPGVSATIMGTGDYILPGESGERDDFQVVQGALLMVWDERE